MPVVVDKRVDQSDGLRELLKDISEWKKNVKFMETSLVETPPDPNAVITEVRGKND